MDGAEENQVLLRVFKKGKQHNEKDKEYFAVVTRSQHQL